MIGEGNNLGAIGSKIEVWNNGSLQYAEKFLSRGYTSSVDPIVHFGVKKNLTIDSVKVIWPLGKKCTTLKNVKVNQLLTILESEAALIKTPKMKDKSQYLFSKASDLIEFTHLEKDYIDFFQGQSIIQHKFSQIGPRMAKGDIDGNGKDDILIGASYEQPAMAFLRRKCNLFCLKFLGLPELK